MRLQSTHCDARGPSAATTVTASVLEQHGSAFFLEAALTPPGRMRAGNHATHRQVPCPCQRTEGQPRCPQNMPRFPWARPLSILSCCHSVPQHPGGLLEGRGQSLLLVTLFINLRLHAHLRWEGGAKPAGCAPWGGGAGGRALAGGWGTFRMPCLISTGPWPSVAMEPGATWGHALRAGHLAHEGRWPGLSPAVGPLGEGQGASLRRVTGRGRGEVATNGSVPGPAGRPRALVFSS